MATPPQLTKLKTSNLRPVPVEDEYTEFVWIGPERSPHAQVFVRVEVLQELIQASLGAPRSTRTALLLGRVGVDVGQCFIEILGYTDLDTHESLREFCRATTDYWPMMMSRLERRDDRLLLMGWACMEAGDKGVLTRVHQVTHRTFFNFPHQVFLLLDPESQHVALYGFDESNRLVHIGYNLVRPRQATSST